MAFRVELSAEAVADAERLYEWVSTAAPYRGPLWFNRLMRAIKGLQTFPERCPHAPENRHFAIEIRQLLFGRKPHVYRVIFTIKDDVVHVLRIRRPRQELLAP